jgi:predicted secreted hydrolase
MTNASRRRLLGKGLLSVLAARSALGAANLRAAPAATSATEVRPRHLVFPRDAGAHPEFKTEWWYITGWLGQPEASHGFQITFFRSRVDGTQGMQSRLSARQLLFAHAAITDVQGKRMWHDQRIARWSGETPGQNPADNASASMRDTGVILRDWSLLREGSDLRARLTAEDFSMDLRFGSTQAVLLQGQQGLSRKGPDTRQSSYYYSLPQLKASGVLTLQGTPAKADTGTAWLDHEWSEEMLAGGAVGWDWMGINLFDGSALTAFRLRDAQGNAIWDDGSFRSGATQYTFSQGEVIFKPVRFWQSPLSRARYPVEWVVRTPADFYTVKAAVDNQELDSRNSTGAIYWEGLCEVWDSNNHRVGRGYLEMTGYASALRLQG